MIRAIEISYVVTGAIAALIVAAMAYASGSAIAMSLAIAAAGLCWTSDALAYMGKSEEIGVGAAIAGIACYAIAAIVTIVTLLF